MGLEFFGTSSRTSGYVNMDCDFNIDFNLFRNKGFDFPDPKIASVATQINILKI